MKNGIIGLMAVIILVLISMQYKHTGTSIYKHFPLVEAADGKAVDVPLYLYIFFTRNNCRDCLEIIEVLNHLPSQFFVIGVVPRADLEAEQEVRAATGADFPFISVDGYKKYIPPYAPSILGLSQEGKIFFVLPAVPNEKKYFEEFLETFYLKAYTSLASSQGT